MHDTNLAVEEVENLQLMNAQVASLFELQHLGRCTALRTLNLHCNALVAIENLTAVATLTELNLSGNNARFI
jgi:Leucine-rich repeat (LRR) protein